METYLNMPLNEKAYRKAKKRVNRKKGFYKHLTSFVIVNTFLFCLNLVTSPGDWWFIFPLMGWGIGLTSHYVSVFGLPIFGTLSDSWEERELEKELMKEEEKEYRVKRRLKADEPLELPDELDLQDFKELRKDWNDKDFV